MPDSRAENDLVYDVVVIGSGAAGCAAAISATEAGASVLVLEKQSPEYAGGNTRVSGGAWFEHRSASGIATYLRALNGDRTVDDDVIDVWAHATGEISAWITALGGVVNNVGDFTAEYPELPGSDSYAGYRSINGAMGGGVFFQFLRSVISRLGINIRYDCRAVELLSSPDRDEVTSVRCADGTAIRARGGIILATGGFEADTTLVRTHLGLDSPPLWGSVAGTGDGLRMAVEVGADLWHMDNMMAVDGIAPPGDRHGFFIGPPHGDLPCIWVDHQGRRFINECAPSGHGQALHDGRYVPKPGHAMTVVFDERTRGARPLSPPAEFLPVGWQILMTENRWSHDNLAEVEQGWILRADTITELGELLDLPAEALPATVAEFNAAATEAIPDRFGRPARLMAPLTTPPFYAYRSAPMLGWTNGGPRRDARARVLRSDRSAIGGLYAAGTVSSTYSWAKDGGFHIADALAFGRIAGAEAARRAAGIEAAGVGATQRVP